MFAAFLSDNRYYIRALYSQTNIPFQGKSVTRENMFLLSALNNNSVWNLLKEPNVYISFEVSCLDINVIGK